MIERNKLGLKEITLEEYIKLKEQIGKPSEIEYSPNMGFCEIIDPLFDTSFYDLLCAFQNDHSGKKASVKLRDGGWLRFKHKNLEEEDIGGIEQLAYENGFLFLSFHVHILDRDNEISFEQVVENEKNVVSASLLIPGTYRNQYDWHGSDSGYKMIRGIYVPEHLEIESLDYLKYFKLPDSEIAKSDAASLMKHVRETGDERNYKLYTVVENFPDDSKQIGNPEFDGIYHELRMDKDPERIFREYPLMVSRFDNNR